MYTCMQTKLMFQALDSLSDAATQIEGEGQGNSNLLKMG
eukprot:COSAG06_NODE_10313_length_1704_cov_3.662784_3_plen_38_part_01